MKMVCRQHAGAVELGRLVDLPRMPYMPARTSEITKGVHCQMSIKAIENIAMLGFDSQPTAGNADLDVQQRS